AFRSGVTGAVATPAPHPVSASAARSAAPIVLPRLAPVALEFDAFLCMCRSSIVPTRRQRRIVASA
ncbi:MAG TPA: hypothetical protein VM694_37755, partial [Polyangium sp.]|nr:hypothetical protein [Polyangium sp.]